MANHRFGTPLENRVERRVDIAQNARYFGAESDATLQGFSRFARGTLIRNVMKEDGKTSLRRIRIHFIAAVKTRRVIRKAHGNTFIHGTAKFVPDDAPDCSRKRSPDLLSKQSFRPARRKLGREG